MVTRPVTHVVAEATQLTPATFAVPIDGQSAMNLVVLVPESDVLFAGAMCMLRRHPAGLRRRPRRRGPTRSTRWSTWRPHRAGTSTDRRRRWSCAAAGVPASVRRRAGRPRARCTAGPWDEWPGRQWDSVNVERAAMLHGERAGSRLPCCGRRSGCVGARPPRAARLIRNERGGRLRPRPSGRVESGIGVVLDLPTETSPRQPRASRLPDRGTARPRPPVRTRTSGVVRAWRARAGECRPHLPGARAAPPRPVVRRWTSRRRRLEPVEAELFVHREERFRHLRRRASDLAGHSAMSGTMSAPEAAPRARPLACQPPVDELFGPGRSASPAAPWSRATSRVRRARRTPAGRPRPGPSHRALARGGGPAPNGSSASTRSMSMRLGSSGRLEHRAAGVAAELSPRPVWHRSLLAPRPPRHDSRPRIAPVSWQSRWTNVMPIRSTTSLVALLAMSSRRSG